MCRGEIVARNLGGEIPPRLLHADEGDTDLHQHRPARFSCEGQPRTRFAIRPASRTLAAGLEIAVEPCSPRCCSSIGLRKEVNGVSVGLLVPSARNPWGRGTKRAE